MTSRSLDIILPCYNPATAWVEHIVTGYKEIAALLPDTNIRVLLVNDGSRKLIDEQDISALKTAIARFEYIVYAQNRGKGYALREGVKISDAEITIYTDVDMPYTTASFMALYQRLSGGAADIAAGVKDAAYYAHVPPFRRFISKLLRSCTSTILRLKVSDTQCGLKGFNAKGRNIFLRTTIDRYLFDLEFIFLASRDKSVRVVPVDITLRDNVVFSSMRMGILLQESGNFVKILLRSIFS
jgi:glycosyltransferase involved in cell wall biosynthesis